MQQEQSWMLALLFLLLRESAAQACCTVQSTPGCTDSTVQLCVCLARPICCTVSWDLQCVNAAGSGCGSTCPSGGCISTCGNGVVECTEQCDLGAPNSNTGACTLSCAHAYCGDGYVETGVEQCDNGAANSNTAPNACRTNCQVAHCGDRVVDTGEACDFGNNTACCVSCANAPGQCSSACANATHGITGACSSGTCSAMTAHVCSPYTCPGSSGCGTSCVDNTGCAGGFVCTAGACVVLGAVPSSLSGAPSLSSALSLSAASSSAPSPSTLPSPALPAADFALPPIPTPQANVPLAAGLGSAVGGAALIVAVVAAVWYLRKRRLAAAAAAAAKIKVLSEFSDSLSRSARPSALAAPGTRPSVLSTTGARPTEKSPRQRERRATRELDWSNDDARRGGGQDRDDDAGLRRSAEKAADGRDKDAAGEASERKGSEYRVPERKRSAKGKRDSEGSKADKRPPPVAPGQLEWSNRGVAHAGQAPRSTKQQLDLWAGRHYESDNTAHIKRMEPRLGDSLSSDPALDLFSGTTEPDFDFTSSAGTW